MAAIGPRDSASLQSVLSSSAASSSTPSAPTERSAVSGRPANIAGALSPPRSDLPLMQREQTVESVRARSNATAQERVGARTAVAEKRLEVAASKVQEARDNGVSLAKASFFKKLLGVAASVITVGVATALTAVSGGIAAPLLAMASVNLAVSAGDALCAFRNMRHAQDLAAGNPNPRPAMPCGNGCLQNLLYAVAKRCGVDNESTRQLIAKGVGGFLQLGLAIGSFVAGGAAGAIALAPKIALMVANVIRALNALETVMNTEMTNSDKKTEENSRTRQMLDDAAKLAATAREIDGSARVNADAAEIQRVVSGDIAALDRSRQLVDTAVRQYGDVAPNLGIAVGACIAVGRAAESIATA